MGDEGETIRTRWMALLAEEGYRPLLEQHGSDPQRWRIAFKVEGVHVMLYLDGRDPTFFSLWLSYALGDLPDDPALLLAAASAVTRQAKGTKAWVDREDRGAYFTYEWFAEELPSPALLERFVSQCRWAADRFVEQAREMAKALVVA